MPTPSAAGGNSHSTGRDGASASASSRRSGRRPSGQLPLLLVVVLAVATLSFFHSVQDLPSHPSTAGNRDNDNRNGNAIHASLQSFKQLARQSRQEFQSPPVRDETDDEDDATATLVDRLKEDPIPNPPLSNGTETFSACLLVMVSTILPVVSSCSRRSNIGTHFPHLLLSFP